MKNFETTLLNTLLEDDLDKLTKMISQELNCFFNITNESFQLISIYPNQYIQEPIWDHYIDGKALPAELVKLLNDNKLIELGYTSNKPYIIPLKNEQGYHRVTAKIYSNEIVYGYITAYFNHEITDAIMNKLEIVQKVISYQMKKQTNHLNYIENIHELFLHNLFNQMIRTEDELNNWKKLIPQPISEPFQIVCASINGKFKYPYLNTIRNEIKRQFHYPYTLIYKDYLVILFANNYANIQQQLLSFLQSYDLKIGISNEFHSLLNSKMYFAQSQSVSIYTNPGEYAYFIDSCLLLMCNQIHNKDIYIHPSFEILKSFDSENKTEYYHTLIAYLECFGSHTMIEKKLKIHRNTVYNRLNMIENLTKIDLTNPHTFTHLYFSYLIVQNAQLNEL